MRTFLPSPGAERTPPSGVGVSAPADFFTLAGRRAYSSFGCGRLGPLRTFLPSPGAERTPPSGVGVSAPADFFTLAGRRAYSSFGCGRLGPLGGY